MRVGTLVRVEVGNTVLDGNCDKEALVAVGIGVRVPARTAAETDVEVGVISGTVVDVGSAGVASNVDDASTTGVSVGKVGLVATGATGVTVCSTNSTSGASALATYSSGNAISLWHAVSSNNGTIRYMESWSRRVLKSCACVSVH